MTVLAPLDTSVSLTEVEIDILNRVDTTVEEAMVTGNPQIAFRFGMALRRTSQVAGLAMAKLLCEMRDRWESFASDDEFKTVAMYEMGISDQTYRKYTDTWDYVINDPTVAEDDTLQERLMGKPMEALIKINPAAKDGQLNKRAWEKLSKAPDVGTVRDLINEIRGIEKPKKSLTVIIQADGTVRAREAGKAYQEVGFLQRDDDDSLRLKLLTWLESCGAVIESER